LKFEEVREFGMAGKSQGISLMIREFVQFEVWKGQGKVKEFQDDFC